MRHLLYCFFVLSSVLPAIGCGSNISPPSATRAVSGSVLFKGKPAAQVSVTFHPMKDGTRGGQFIQATLPGGKQVVRANARDENE